MKTTKILLSTGLALGLAALGACASNPTKVDQVWVAPGVTKIDAKRVILIALAPSETARMRMETELASHMTRSNPSMSNTLLSADELKDPAKAAAKVKSAGFDTAVVLRLVESQTHTLSQPQAMQTYMGTSTYYSRNITNQVTNYVIETTIFDVAEGKPLARVTTETFQAADPAVLASRLFESVAGELRSRGLIP